MPPDTIYRFDELQYAEKFVKEGVVTFNLAAAYDDSKFSVAQRDDELRRKVAPNVPEHQILIQDPNTGVAQQIHGLVSVNLSFEAHVNGEFLRYYILCCSLSLAQDQRFYSEFGKDCMITISDPEEFERRLGKAVEASPSGWELLGDAVEYYDTGKLPHWESLADLMFAKEQRYDWQTKFRYALVAPPDKAAPGRVSVTLGSLEDICTITPRP